MKRWLAISREYRRLQGLYGHYGRLEALGLAIYNVELRRR